MSTVAENKFADISTEFAIQILGLTDSIKGDYSLSNQLERSGTSISSRMVNNETKSIQYENIETMCLLLNCTPNDLLIITEE